MSDRPEAQAAMTRTTQEVLRLVPNADGCMVALVVGDQLVEASRAGDLGGSDQICWSINKSLSGLSFLSGSAFRCDDADKSPFVDHATAKRVGASSFVSAPLRAGVRSIGVVIAASKDRSAFNERDVDMLTNLAHALENELAPHVRRIRRFSSAAGQ